MLTTALPRIIPHKLSLFHCFQEVHKSDYILSDGPANVQMFLPRLTRYCGNISFKYLEPPLQYWRETQCIDACIEKCGSSVEECPTRNRENPGSNLL